MGSSLGMREAEIGHFDDPIVAQQDVVALQVAVDDLVEAKAVQVVHALGHAHHDIKYPLCTKEERIILQGVEQAAPSAPFRQNAHVRWPGGGTDVQDNVRVSQPAQNLDFVPQVLQDLVHILELIDFERLDSHICAPQHTSKYFTKSSISNLLLALDFLEGDLPLPDKALLGVGAFPEGTQCILFDRMHPPLPSLTVFSR